MRPTAPYGSVFSILALAAVASASLPACGSQSDGALEGPPAIDLGAGNLTVRVLPQAGTFSVSRGGALVVDGAVADALVDDGTGPRLVSTSDGSALVRQGDAFTCVSGGVELTLTFAFPAGGDHLTASLAAKNVGPGALTVLELSPLVVTPEHGGALFVGAAPRRHRVLENGRFIAFDQTVQLVTGDVDRFSLGFSSPIPLRGNSVSNGNHVVADLDDPSRSVVAGWLTFDRAIPTIGVGYDAAASRTDDAGRSSFTTYAAETALIFHGKKAAPGESVASELFYFDPLPSDPLEGLERYATAVAANLGITPWTRRGPGHDVPNGWNSWTGGGTTGGYGQSIDSALVAASTDVLRRQLLPFGDTYMQVDDGWQLSHGDWQWNPQTFPEGGAAVASSIGSAGFVPGLWIAPFIVDDSSALAKAHPDWIAPKEDNLFGAVGSSNPTVDVSSPAVQKWVHDTFAGIRQDGFRWVKGDFTYWALLGKTVADPSLTNVEAFRAAWRQIRDAVGPDTFLLGIGLMSANVGIVDGMRLTLDNGPKWDEASGDDVLGSPRAFKGTVRTGSRRWFYQDRVWVNHDDLLFFRAWPDPAVPALTLEESRTFATWIGLGGGSVELGDKLLDLDQHPEWIDIVRRLLPAWPAGARPLDVLLRDYPEHFRSHVSAPAGEWDVVGLFNWGKNRDWSTEPPAPMGEEKRSYAVACEGECLAYEFWSETFLGKKTGSFTVEVDPRRTKVLALRAPTGAPQLLGTNRHVTQGATDLGAITWDASTKTLSGTLAGCVGTTTAPWEYHLAFYVPAPLALDHAEVDGVASPATTTDGEVVRVAFSLPASAQGKSTAFRLVVH